MIQDETAALAISVNSTGMYTKYAPGQEVVIDLTDMYIGKYNGTQQLGYPLFYEKNQVWEATFMPRYCSTRTCSSTACPKRLK